MLQFIVTIANIILGLYFAGVLMYFLSVARKDHLQIRFMIMTSLLYPIMIFDLVIGFYAALCVCASAIISLAGVILL